MKHGENLIDTYIHCSIYRNFSVLLLSCRLCKPSNS